MIGHNTTQNEQKEIYYGVANRRYSAPRLVAASVFSILFAGRNEPVGVLCDLQVCKENEGVTAEVGMAGERRQPREQRTTRHSGRAEIFQLVTVVSLV